MDTAPVRRTIRLVTVASAALGTVSRIVLSARAGSPVDIFGYFTVQSNLLVLVFLLASLVAAATDRPLHLFARRIHGGVLLSILVTAIIYNALLAGDVAHGGFSGFILVVNHTITPVLFLIDWVANHERARYGLRDVGVWLIYPVAYAVFASVEGGITGRFRYFFLDFVNVPLEAYLLQLTGVTLFFFALSALIVGANRLLVRRGEVARTGQV